MATLLDLKARIKAVANIKKITRAMQLVAAAKFTRAQNRARASRPYTKELDDILGVLATLTEMLSEEERTGRTIDFSFKENEEPLRASWSKLLEQKEETKPGLVLITADRGLCGAFNTRLLRAAHQFIDEHEGKDYKLLLIGKKGYTYFRTKKHPIIYHRHGISDKLNLDEIKEVARNLVELFINDEVDALHLIYTRFKSAMISHVTQEKFLSIPPVKEKETAGADLYILEPDRDVVFQRLFPLYATTKIFSALAESFASEYGSRMTAMQLATKNAEEMLDSLIIERNRLRQAIITKELAEIVGGAEALK
ncbi:MAG: ATP synthase F1 subunit gamma [Candidatus Latescibacteria bacterium]|nr:ATP synthase F1 subunit gamma [Candidatus Latescibacterota bacterium]NIM21204.1 ATP synthase F1 subunit gamma [Candidatus Latescibacterota bacterium]NIM65458.1 ATP synthase F1 subunit gamma [Candidatus Latescibacterota bacterium]NIO01836.1 ATP synthase F1 subunit gamma [Candidatus Latescibacterota bacterium]NIO28486.1 ATP synthase F1 subunit gamma [Candidatus Latescibacterota bacterium]